MFQLIDTTICPQRSLLINNAMWVRNQGGSRLDWMTSWLKAAHDKRDPRVHKHACEAFHDLEAVSWLIWGRA